MYYFVRLFSMKEGVLCCCHLEWFRSFCGCMECIMGIQGSITVYYSWYIGCKVYVRGIYSVVAGAIVRGEGGRW